MKYSPRDITLEYLVTGTIRKTTLLSQEIASVPAPQLFALKPLSVPGFGFFSGGNDVELRSPHRGGDPFQREVLADLLKSEGLEVVECANGEVAELVLATTGAELRALVTDLELGGKMSGVELAQYTKRQFPGLNVVMVSGHGPPYVPHEHRVRILAIEQIADDGLKVGRLDIGLAPCKAKPAEITNYQINVLITAPRHNRRRQLRITQLHDERLSLEHSRSRREARLAILPVVAYLSRMPKCAFDPCIPTRGPKVPNRPEWLHEIKHDGYRLIVQRESKRVRLFTRNGHDWSHRFRSSPRRRQETAKAPS